MTQAVLKNPYLVIVLALAIVVLGAYSYPKIPKDLLPIFETPAVQIVTFYPGMPPVVMEKDIMSRMQRWTGQSIGIEHQEARAMTGVCVVKDFFREGTDVATAVSQVSMYAMSDMFYLPPGTIPPMVMPYDPTASLPLCLVVVSSPGMDEQQLYDIAYYELRNKLQSIQGVIAPAVFGGKLRRIYAYMEPDKLEAYGLTLMDVQRALSKYNVLIPAGNMKVGDADFQMFTNAVPETIDELNETIVKVANGIPVKISDLGRVENSSQIQSNIVRINGKRQAYIPIYRQPGANSIEIVDTIERDLASILVNLKTERSGDTGIEDLVLSVAMNQTGPVKKSINGLILAGGLGALLAGGVVLVFLRNLRSTAIIVLAIPLAIATAIVGLYFTGDTINAMTLGGLALAVGILVDQSIVVLENVVRHVKMGKAPPQAALDGASEVAIPLLVSTLTFVVVFFPVVFLKGLAAYLFTPLAVAATIAIFASYFLSLTLVPAYCAQFLKLKQDDAEEVDGPFTAAYRKLLRALLILRYPVAIVAAVGAVIAIIAATQLGRQLIPPVDAGQITLNVRMPSGTNINVTNAKIDEIEKSIIAKLGTPDPQYAYDNEQHADSDLQLLISNIGVLMDWPAAYTPNVGPADAFMLLQLKGKLGRPGAFAYADLLREELNQEFPNVEFAFDTGGTLTSAMNMGEPAPLHFQVRGSKLDTMQAMAQIVQREVEAVEGTVDVRIAQRLDYPTMTIKMDRDLAARVGLTPEDVMKNLVSATNSSVGFDPAFWIDNSKGNHYFIGVQYPEELLTNFDTIRKIPVGFQNGSPVRLENIATIETGTGAGSVSHRNISRVMDVYANVASGYDVGTAMSRIESRLLANNDLELEIGSDNRGELYKPLNNKFAGHILRTQGEVKSMRETFEQFVTGLVIAAVLVYLVMVAQFRSFVDPLVILLTVPLGFIGVVIAMLVTGTSLSIMSFMGIIMMVGIVVEYAIVLIDFANQRVEEGLTVRDAIVDAAAVRLRPIIMTSLTTWLALLPMAIGGGGADANAPLARTIIGGVVAATLLTLLVTPCLYLIFKREPTRQPPIDHLATA